MDQDLLRLYNNIATQVDLQSTYVTSKSGETNHLEFKEKRDTRIPALGHNDKYNFSKALSSFSNGDGGLLVWGISTRKKDGRDYASTLKPIKQVETFAESLRDSLIDSVIPRNHKVKIKAIANRQGNGFVVCMIPAAADVPVRAMSADREYWVRTDGRTMKLEHYQIKDMMLRHAHPDLVFSVTTSGQGLPSDQIKLEFTLRNNGKSLAKYWGYFVQMPSIPLLKTDECRDVSSLNPGTTCVTCDGGIGSVIHPHNISVTVGGIVTQKPSIAQQVSVGVKWYCEDMSLKQSNFMVTLPAAPSTST